MLARQVSLPSVYMQQKASDARRFDDDYMHLSSKPLKPPHWALGSIAVRAVFGWPGVLSKHTDEFRNVPLKCFVAAKKRITPQRAPVVVEAKDRQEHDEKEVAPWPLGAYLVEAEPKIGDKQGAAECA